jgi:hypothetical protein
MGRFKHWVGLVVAAMAVVACGDDDDGKDNGGGSGSAAHICMEQIACGWQAADQASCTQLFEAFFTPAQIAACDACVTAEGCDTEADVCTDVCTL